MSLYRRKYNPIPNTSLVPTANVLTFKDGVANQAALPLTGNAQNDARIAADTGVLYVWSISSSSGLLTDWISQGDITDLKWSAIEDKPTSSVTNIDDAVSKRHTQGTDQGLDTGGANAVTAAQVKQAVTDDHTHSNKTILDNIQEALTTVLKSAYDACVTFIANFDISSPSIDDTLVWNGSQYTNKPLKETMGQSVSYFFDDTVSDIPGYNTLSVVPIGGSEEIDTAIVNNNTVLIDDYISSALGGTEINAGLWEFTLWVGTTNAGATNFVDVEVYKRTSVGSETLLFTVSTPDLTTTNINEQNIKTAQPTFAINSTDRLVVKVYGRTTGGTNRTISFVHNGTDRYSHFHTPLILRHNSLNGLNEGDYKHLTAVEYLPIPTLASDLTDITLNIMLNAFRIAQIGSLTIFNMVKGFMDEFVDESGIDAGSSSGQTYDSINSLYKNYSILDSETVLLLHFDNNVTDSETTPKTVTNNNVTFSSSEKKFGTHGAVFNGTDAYLTIPDSSDWDFGTGDFTIDFWFKSPSPNHNSYFFSRVVDSGGDDFRCGLLNTSGYLFYQFGASSGSYSTNYADSNWHHLAIVRYSNIILIFIDGSDITSGGFANNTNIQGSAVFNIGAYTGGSFLYSGYLDEYRISKGIARWTSNFTPPTMQYPISGNMILQSNTQVSSLIPSLSRIVLFEEDVDAVTLNTDLKVYVSRDNGTTFSQIILEDEGNYITGSRILSGVVDISTQPSGTNMKYKIETLNDKKLNLHGVGLSWK